MSAQPCVRLLALFVAALGLVQVGASACSGSSERICAPNLTTACRCENGTTGNQVCKEDGTGFGACACGVSQADAGAPDAAGGGDASPQSDLGARTDRGLPADVVVADIGLVDSGQPDRVAVPDADAGEPDLPGSGDAGADLPAASDLGGIDRAIIVGPLLTAFDLPRSLSSPRGITVGADGALWFALGDSIGRITTDGQLSENPVGSARGIAFIARGPDGNIWFLEQSTYQVASMTASGAITEFATGQEFLQGITTGPDGNLWYTEGDHIVRRRPDGSQPTPFPIGPGASGSRITVGPDGNLWFANFQDSVGRITPTGSIQIFPLTPGDDSQAVATGPDGNLWVTHTSGKAISRVTTAGAFTRFDVGGQPALSPTSITAGPDGALWFADNSQRLIGRITVAGEVTVVTMPGQTNDLVTGPDGALWITIVQAKIARFFP